jgi:hypothetical protein
MTITGCWSGVMLARLNPVEQALAALDEQIENAMTPWARQLELLQTIPGIGLKTAQVIIAETGADMSRFPSAGHLAAWAGLAPAMHESAGHRSPAGSRQGNKWLASMLVEAANSVSRTKDTYLAARFARIAARRGKKRASVMRSEVPAVDAGLPLPAPCGVRLLPRDSQLGVVLIGGRTYAHGLEEAEQALHLPPKPRNRPVAPTRRSARANA